MTFREVQAKSLLRRQRRVDSWFLCSCGLNLYRGCGHDCAYGDGRAAEAGVGFIVFGGLTLKPGRQMEHYLEMLAGFRPELEARCRRLYPGNPWGNSSSEHYRRIERRLLGLARRHGVPLRIPPALYGGVLSAADRALVTLEHLDYLLRLRGERSPYGAAARELAARPEIAEDAQQPLFPELAPEASAVLDELRRAGRSSLLERLLVG